MDDHFFMHKAIQEALLAYEKGEVPVGAIIVAEQRIIARGHNLTEILKDVTAHAEMQAITSASHFIGGKYLNSCTMYVTLEPCAMCAGALFWSQMGRLVFGAYDPHRGFIKNGVSLHPKTELIGGVLEHECSQLLKKFFSEKRTKL